MPGSFARTARNLLLGLSFAGLGVGCAPLALQGQGAGTPAVLAAAAGGQADASGSASASAPALQADGALPVYRVTRGDTLDFRFIYTPELDTKAAVRSDGRLALPLIGDLQVEGLTVEALRQDVERRLAAQVRRPQVVINVQGTGSQRVFVGGEVNRPGVQPLLGPLTVMQAVMAAEGLRDTAQPASVVLLRRDRDGRTQATTVDMARLMAGDGAIADPTLQPFDVVLVPRSGIANLNLWVDQYVRRALPLSLGFSYTINRNGSLQ